MTQINLKHLLKSMPKAPKKDDNDVMSSPDYLRKSSQLITEALQKGFDVMQLENGDVVTTGVKTIVTTYRWDTKTKKMVKSGTKEKKG